MHKRALEAEKRIITARLKADQHLAPLLRDTALAAGGSDMELLVQNMQHKESYKEEVAKFMSHKADMMEEAIQGERAKAQNALGFIEARYTKEVHQKEQLKNEHKKELVQQRERNEQLENHLVNERQKARTEACKLRNTLQTCEAANRQALADKIEAERRHQDQIKALQNEVTFWRTCTAGLGGGLILAFLCYVLWLFVSWLLG
jgi:hypothetical protein